MGAKEMTVCLLCGAIILASVASEHKHYYLPENSINTSPG